MSKYQYTGGDRFRLREDWLNQSMAQAILLSIVYGTSLIVESRRANVTALWNLLGIPQAQLAHIANNRVIFVDCMSMK